MQLREKKLKGKYLQNSFFYFESCANSCLQFQTEKFQKLRKGSRKFIVNPRISHIIKLRAISTLRFYHQYKSITIFFLFKFLFMFLLYIWLFHYSLIYFNAFLLLKNWLNRYFTWFIWFFTLFTCFLLDFNCVSFIPYWILIDFCVRKMNRRWRFYKLQQN